MLELTRWQDAMLILALVVFFGAIISRLTERPRIPDVAAFVVLGIVLGPACLHVLRVAGGSGASQFAVYTGAALLLFEGGCQMNLTLLRRAALTIGLLATLGVLITAMVVALAAAWLFHLPFLWCLLLGSIIASTDPATLIPVFARTPIRWRLQQALEAESAVNDATASVLFTVVLASVKAHQSLNLTSAFAMFGREAGIGLGVGIAFGLLGTWLTSENGPTWLRLHTSVVAVAIALGGYAFAADLGGSGLMSAFAAGAVFGSPGAFGMSRSQAQFVELGYVALPTAVLRMLIFTLLGAEVQFSALGRDFGSGLAVAAALMFVARPLTVLACVPIDRFAKWSTRELTLMMWVRETGVIPAALATSAAAAGVPHARDLMAVTFLAILSTILLQATSTGWIAGLLGLERETQADEEFL
ncbi:sodium:proton antiporter [Alicyclobacillus sacchari]|uniref:cation:proton antiporter n=1 Tax=Alicyclobacillus sacchari TaxID=392010 RepID=UPI0023E92E76|nr:cation:proton antiporter [Alicyclobacillus sacchari]GMA56036.1 sodium:proton antiporter [Alicyclobacillus sacchari]